MKITNKKKIGTEKKEAEKYDLEEIKIDPAGKREFYIVDKRILPNSIQSVIKVNDLVQHSKMSKYEAIKKVGISRSTYYKYKDYIFQPSDNSIGKKALLSIMVKDKKGVLSGILNLLYSIDCNILTINQNIPINGTASVTISIDLSDSGIPIEDIIICICDIENVITANLLTLE